MWHPAQLALNTLAPSSELAVVVSAITEASGIVKKIVKTITIAVIIFDIIYILNLDVFWII